MKRTVSSRKFPFIDINSQRSESVQADMIRLPFRKTGLILQILRAPVAYLTWKSACRCIMLEKVIPTGIRYRAPMLGLVVSIEVSYENRRRILREHFECNVTEPLHIVFIACMVHLPIRILARHKEMSAEEIEIPL